jgi:hypothetical protein
MRLIDGEEGHVVFICKLDLEGRMSTLSLQRDFAYCARNIPIYYWDDHNGEVRINCCTPSLGVILEIGRTGEIE